MYLLYARRLRDHLLYPVHYLRVNRVHQALPHCLRGVLEDYQDGKRDEEAYQRVREREAEPHARHADQHCERGKPVGAGVLTVGDERRAAYLVAYAHAKLRDRFVADEAEYGGGSHPDQVGRSLWVGELRERLVGGDKCAPEYHRYDDDTRHVLGATITVRVAAGGRALAQREG